MKKKFLKLTVLCLFMSSYVFSQETTSNELKINFYTLNTDIAYINRGSNSLFSTGFVYKRGFSKFSLTFGLVYSENLINDDCPDCRDALEGTGELREFRFDTGIEYAFRRDHKLKPFIETGLFYAQKKYSGGFGGGFSGEGAYIDYDYLNFGLYERVGISYNFYNSLFFDISSSGLFGYSKRTSIFDPEYYVYKPSLNLISFNYIELGIGYVF